MTSARGRLRAHVHNCAETRSAYSRNKSPHRAIVVPLSFTSLLMTFPSADLDGLRFLALSAWPEERDDAVAILSLDAFGVDFNRQGHSTIEPAREPFAAVRGGLLRERDRFMARKPQGSALDLQVEVGFFHAGLR